MKYSPSQENYIKAVYHLQLENSTVTTNALAQALDTRPASVTDMLKKLKLQKLLLYEKYRGVKLTAEGRRLAVQIIRKHRLWEFFLVNTLRFGWEEVHEIAEELEHIGSGKLVDRLDAFLGFPQHDPHGDPIPDRLGKLPAGPHSTLSEMPLHRHAVVRGIGDQRPVMLDLLRDQQIALGTKLEVQKKFLVDGSVQIKIRGRQPVNISAYAAKNILVGYDKKKP